MTTDARDAYQPVLHDLLTLYPSQFAGPTHVALGYQQVGHYAHGWYSYRAGEDCRDDDHGKHGIAADGEAITCVDHDCWRWEQT